MPDLDGISAQAAAVGLVPVGALHPEGMPGVGTVVLLGPDEPDFWRIFQASPEFRDGAADPVDRWSARVVGALAAALGGSAYFPFEGPPWQPFTTWARASGAIADSPVGLLVHAERGLFISFRGAIGFGARLDLPAPVARPCESCVQPCRTACPVGALGTTGYDVAACHRHLDTPEGRDCLDLGCAVRRACPIGRSLRQDAQSGFHMTAFHGTDSTCED